MLTAPMLTTLQLIGVPSDFRLITHSTSLSISHKKSPTTFAASCGVVSLWSENNGASFTSLIETTSSLNGFFFGICSLPSRLNADNKLSLLPPHQFQQFFQRQFFWCFFHIISLLSGLFFPVCAPLSCTFPIKALVWCVRGKRQYPTFLVIVVHLVGKPVAKPYF